MRRPKMLDLNWGKMLGSGLQYCDVLDSLMPWLEEKMLGSPICCGLARPRSLVGAKPTHGCRVPRLYGGSF